MKVYATKGEIFRALDKINEGYKNNIIFNRMDAGRGNYWNVRLKTINFNKPGYRVTPELKGWDGRVWHKGHRMRFACWHVYGNFMEALFEINPKAYVYAQGRKITKDQGNWEDYNVGSNMFPFYASEACDCAKFEHEIKFADLELKNNQLQETNVRLIKQSDIGKCRFYIFNPSHYREDGTCKCNDLEHRKMMIKEWGYKTSDFIGIRLINK